MKKDFTLLKTSTIVYLLLGLTNAAISKNEIALGRVHDLIRLLSFVALIFIALGIFRYFKSKNSEVNRVRS